jgi:NTP pyrophosphatase (non-canonical NTP hydrolase)
MIKKQFEKITIWQKETFGQVTALSKINHLLEEIEELKWALDSDDTDISVEEEFADCFILLFGAAALHGYTFDSICKIIDAKMEINYKRKWGKPKENGVVNHIDEQAATTL